MDERLVSGHSHAVARLSPEYGIVKPRHAAPGARVRLVLGPGRALGPGKADILDGVRETGSIAAAGRRLKMSYRRAWQLVEELNGYFDAPLVETVKGGTAGGGARLTELGEEVLARYRRVAAAADSTADGELAALLHRLAPPPPPRS